MPVCWRTTAWRTCCFHWRKNPGFTYPSGAKRYSPKPAETRRTQVGRLEWPERIADSFQTQLRAVFPESLAQGFEHLIGECTNDKKDRHVLACAIHSKAEVILTFNLKDFPEESLSRWQVSAEHPQDYLIMLFRLEPLQVMQHLGAIAGKRGCSLEDHLIDLGRFVPAFSTVVLDELD